METLLDRLKKDRFDPRLSRRNLSYFYTSATLGNFTKAAQVCGVAQPSLSRGITLIEDSVGATLFTRMGRNVELTPIGVELLPIVELYLNQSLDLATELDAGKKGIVAPIKLASVSSLTSDVLLQLLSRFEESHHNVQIKLLDGTNSDVKRAVDVGEADLGIVLSFEDPERFRSTPLFSDQYCIVVNQHHHFFERSVVRWQELENEKIATFEPESNSYETIENVFRDLGMYFSPSACVRFRNTLMGLVRHRSVLAILPRLVFRPDQDRDLRAILLSEPDKRRTYYLLDRKGRSKCSSTRALASFLVSEFSM